MILASSVLMLRTLFQTILEMVRSAVLVANSPGYAIRLPPAVILTQLRSSFCGLKSITMQAYVTIRSMGIFLIWSLESTKIESVPVVPVRSSPCAKFPNAFPNARLQISLVAGSFTSVLYLVIVSHVTGCTTGAQK